MRKAEIIIILIILLSIAIDIYFYPKLPETLASHWNAHGQVNGYMPKFWAVFLLPIICIALFLLFLIIPRIDPMKENIAKFRKYYDGFILYIVLFMIYIHLLTIFWNLNYITDIVKWLVPSFAVLFYSIGVLLAHSEQNWFIGIRTPWTLSSKNVWKKTHKLGATLFKISAIISLFGFFIPEYAIALVIIPIIIFSIYLIVYSYIEYRKEKKKM